MVWAPLAGRWRGSRRRLAAESCAILQPGRKYDTPYEQVDLETLLGESDVVSIHAPLNPATENLMTKEKFAMMKKSAILINVGRGPIVNEKDLAEALNAGVIAGAGLDVLSAEPMKADNPLLAVQDSRKLVITPHIAWHRWKPDRSWWTKWRKMYGRG